MKVYISPIVRMATVGAILVFAGCQGAHISALSESGSPADGTGSALNPNIESLGVSVSLLTPQVESGDPVEVHVVLDNHREPPFQIIFGTGCQFTWIITAADGRVAIPDHICTMATSYLKFGSDGLYQRDMNIRTFRDSDRIWPFDGDELPIGRYKLEVYLYGHERQMNTEAVWFDVVE